MTVLDVQQAVYGNNIASQLEDEEGRILERRAFIHKIINEGNLKKMTSVHAACLAGNVPIVKMLLENGGDLSKRDHVSQLINNTNLSI